MPDGIPSLQAKELAGAADLHTGYEAQLASGMDRCVVIGRQHPVGVVGVRHLGAAQIDDRSAQIDQRAVLPLSIDNSQARAQAQVLGNLQVHFGFKAVLLRIAQVDDALDHLAAYLRLEFHLPIGVVDIESSGAQGQPVV